MTQADKIFIMEKYLKEMDSDNDDHIEPEELKVWIDYLEARKVHNDILEQVKCMSVDTYGQFCKISFFQRLYKISYS